MNDTATQCRSEETRTKRRIVVLGSGAHAKVVIEILEAMSHFEILGCCSSDPDHPEAVSGYPFLGDFERLRQLYRAGIRYAANGVGGWTDNLFRETVFHLAEQMGFTVVRAVHPTAIVPPNVRIGEGSIVGAGTVLVTEASIGKNVIVSPGVLIGHETTIGDHVLISGAAKIGAQVEVKDRAILAFGCTVVSRVTIGREALVAAGALAVEDVADKTWVFGVPAKPRKRIPVGTHETRE